MENTKNGMRSVITAFLIPFSKQEASLLFQLSGVRELPTPEAIACVHQLEMELGAFQRTVTLPAVVDVDRVQSAYSSGILAVTLPKRARKGRVTICIKPGA